MTRKQRRAVLIGTCLAVLGVAVGLVLFALRDSIVFFYTPSEVAEKQLAPGQRFRLGGLVEDGSVKRGEGTTVSFVVTDKRRGAGRDERAVFPHRVLIGVTAMALVWSALGLGFGVTEDAVGAGVAAFWALYNLTLMILVAAFAERPVQKRQAVRFRASVPVELLESAP